MTDKTGIDALLDLSGQVIDQEGGYWVRLEAWRVDPSPAMPHGIRYALTLHNAYGTASWDSITRMRYGGQGKIATRDAS